MIIPFRALPGMSADVLRPAADVAMAVAPDVRLTCLMDTGTLDNRFGAWVADAAGIDLRGLPAVSIGVGGRSTIGRTALVQLDLLGAMWEAPVSFCDPWPWPFHLLGQRGFFRWFRVCVEAADERVEVTPLVS